MLIPRKVAHRKQHRPHRTGNATGGTHVSFGEYGIQALEHAYVTNRQIEAARIAMTRHIRRGGKVWIYRGDAAPTRAGREAQAAALRAAQQRTGRPTGQDRPRRGGRSNRPDSRGDRPERGSAPSAEPSAETSGEG